MKKSLILIMVCVALIVAGCSSKEKEKQSPESANLVASEKTLPSGFESIAEAHDPKNHFAVLVTNQEDYEAMWQQFQLDGEIPEVDLMENDLFFIGMFESSSCPYEIDSMDAEPVTKELSINFSPLADACTADLSPRSFVIAVQKEISSQLDTLLLVSQGKQTKVPIQPHEEILKKP
ncbi:hypothetical protein [Sporosarcina sp. D27]|uniref:hypothetical protein n=1 Tax=Sporosarcina sp. D27 TaxID=1382305 RepID=UPI00046EB78A|nr:hypothetical protein [Sporosarcina sp. D27]